MLNPPPGARVERSCPVCAGRDSVPHLAKGTLSLVRCQRCSMVFATPVDRGLVEGGSYAEAGARYYTSPTKLAGDFNPVRFRREVALVRKHCPSGRILDVGCGTGAFLDRLRTEHPGTYEMTGIDVSTPALAHATGLGLATAAVRLDAPDFQPAPFDAITFWAVLEHVPDPLGYMRKAAALLRPGGVCVVLVPNMGSLAVRLLGARYRYIMPEHINAFTAHTLTRLASAVPELTVVRLGSSHFNPVVIYEDFRRARELVPDADRARLLVRTNAWKSSRWLRPVHALYRLSERFLGSLRLADNLILVMRKR